MMAKPWNEHRETITRLYIRDGRKLEDVRTIMKTQYGFEASTRSYRQHFDIWGLFKYNCKKRDLRRKESLARSLPSPPQTPTVHGLPPLEAKLEMGGPVNMPSPESLSYRGRMRSLSSLSSLSGGGQSPEQRPLPDLPPHRLDYPSRFQYYENNMLSDSMKNKSMWGPKCLRAMQTNLFNEDELQIVSLRNPSLNNGVHCHMNMNNSRIEAGKLPKYLQPTTLLPNNGWSLSRPMPMNGNNEEYHRFHGAMRGSQGFPPSVISGSMMNRTSLPSPIPVSRLPVERSPSHEGVRIKEDPDQLSSSVCPEELGPVGREDH